MKLRASVFLLTPLLLLPACVDTPDGSGESASPAEPTSTAVGESSDLPDRGTAHVWTPGGALEVSYERHGDKVVFQDDMMVSLDEFTRALVSDDELAAIAAGESRVERAAVRAIGRYRWPGGVVPFRLAANLSAAQVTAANTAIANWEAATNFDFVVRTNQADFVEFQIGDVNGNSCRSDVGRQGGMQEIEIGPCGANSVTHEIGHTVGFYHEQTRYDRDQFVTIMWANIQAGKENNFKRYVDFVDSSGYTRDGSDAGPYEYGSIMHYGGNAFSANGQPTIVPTQSGVTLGSSTLSAGDIRAANKLISPGGTIEDGAKIVLFSGSSFSGASVSLGMGYHHNSEFTGIGDNNVSSMIIPAGLVVSAWSNGVDDPTRRFGTNQLTMPSGWDNQISAVDVRRGIRVYRDANQGGIAQGFPAGEWKANAGHLDTIGNDQISSIYVPPGLVAELCWAETGAGSTGSYCQTFEGGSSNVTGTLDNQTSLIRVKNAVTVYQEGNLWGTQKSFTVGSYSYGSFAPVVNSSISSLIAGDDVKVTLCDGASGGAPCEVYRGEVHFVGGRMNDQTSWLKVEVNTVP